MGLSFFTALKYNQPHESYSSFFLEHFDDYFYLGGKKAYVIQSSPENTNEQAVLANEHSSILATVGKVLSYFTLILPLIALIAKAVLRSIHSYKLIDPKLELEKGIHISESTLSKVQQLMPKIQNVKNDKELHWLGKGNNLVFQITQTPDLVFKLSPKDPTGEDCKNRFANMIKAKETCLAHKLGLLIIPQAKTFNVKTDQKNWSLIAEKRLDFNQDCGKQEELYNDSSSSLNEPVRQLATFIAKTGFDDVNWRNIPILNKDNKLSDHRCIGLIDLEHMDSTLNGFIGDPYGNRGLIRSVSEKQIDLVIEEAHKNGISIPDDVKSRRLQEIKSNQKLQEYYQEKRIIKGKEPLNVNIDSLGLDLSQEEQVYTFCGSKAVPLRRLVQDVISQINQTIQEAPDTTTIKEKRHLLVQNPNLPFSLHHTFRTIEEAKKHWLHRIFQALVEKNYLFKVDFQAIPHPGLFSFSYLEIGYIYSIQA